MEMEAFDDLCKKLNSIEGPQRDATHWKQTFNEWECKVKAKARRIYLRREMTGGGVSPNEFLTALEEKLLSLISKILLFGHPDIIELGFQKYSKKPCITYKVNKKCRKYLKTKTCAVWKWNGTQITKSWEKLNESLRLLMEAVENLAGAIHSHP
ncbi:uncharacterized protein LOC116175521 [Photinus pyralis]|uniref:uncharacterized protein LOC116175521 n=1 Tax=Photinus pyralis TaxID=7054 RepID=UPI00126710E4|nr:uncharacterized protein LOC116175521 [Photinus pyralis]